MILWLVAGKGKFRCQPLHQWSALSRFDVGKDKNLDGGAATARIVIIFGPNLNKLIQ